MFTVAQILDLLADQLAANGDFIEEMKYFFKKYENKVNSGTFGKFVRRNGLGIDEIDCLDFFEHFYNDTAEQDLSLETLITLVKEHATK